MVFSVAFWVPPVVLSVEVSFLPSTVGTGVVVEIVVVGVVVVVDAVVDVVVGTRAKETRQRAARVRVNSFMTSQS